MTVEKPTGNYRTNNHRMWKWVSGIVSTLFLAGVLGLISTIRNIDRDIENLRTNQLLMGEAVGKNDKWIRDWSAVLKVPERDQAQDSAIEELRRRVRILEQNQ